MKKEYLIVDEKGHIYRVKYKSHMVGKTTFTIEINSYELNILSIVPPGKPAGLASLREESDPEPKQLLLDHQITASRGLKDAVRTFKIKEVFEKIV